MEIRQLTDAAEKQAVGDRQQRRACGESAA